MMPIQFDFIITPKLDIKMILLFLFTALGPPALEHFSEFVGVALIVH
jgi:hypothetical protein